MEISLKWVKSISWYNIIKKNKEFLQKKKKKIFMYRIINEWVFENYCFFNYQIKFFLEKNIGLNRFYENVSGLFFLAFPQ